MPANFKLGRLLDDNECVEHSHARLYYKEEQGENLTVIVAGLPGRDVTVVKNLARSLNDHCYLLYVHHTPRTDHEEGRYQSPLLEIDAVDTFLQRFGIFWRQMSVTISGYIVLDFRRHWSGTGTISSIATAEPLSLREIWSCRGMNGETRSFRFRILTSITRIWTGSCSPSWEP
jgi:hypothetical protein